MRSGRLGRLTSGIEVTNISTHGFWLFLEGREIFISFDEFPWFRDASIAQLTDVELQSPDHLYWPQLDVDLAVESLDHPDRYPLVSRLQPRASRVGERHPNYRSKRGIRRA